MKSIVIFLVLLGFFLPCLCLSNEAARWQQVVDGEELEEVLWERQQPLRQCNGFPFGQGPIINLTPENDLTNDLATALVTLDRQGRTLIQINTDLIIREVRVWVTPENTRPSSREAFIRGTIPFTSRNVLFRTPICDIEIAVVIFVRLEDPRTRRTFEVWSTSISVDVTPSTLAFVQNTPAPEFNVITFTLCCPPRG